MNPLIVSVLAWLVGLAALFLPFVSIDGELAAVASPSLLVSSVLTFALLNTPGLLCLRQFEHRRALAVPVLIVNVPAVLFAVFLAGRTLPPSAALMFTGTLVIIGTAFSLALLWNSKTVASDE